MTSAVTYRAFSDELVKIAEEKASPMTKVRWKALATTVAPATALGFGIGAAGRYGIKKLVESKGKQLKPGFVRKWGPAIAAAAAAGSIAAWKVHDNSSDKAYGKVDDKAAGTK